MDFSRQIVSAWARQDATIDKRRQPGQKVLPAAVQSSNQNGRLILTTPDGSLSYNPTNSNAQLATGSSIRLGSGVALTRVASV